MMSEMLLSAMEGVVESCCMQVQQMKDTQWQRPAVAFEEDRFQESSTSSVTFPVLAWSVRTQNAATRAGLGDPGVTRVSL